MSWEAQLPLLLHLLWQMPQLRAGVSYGLSEANFACLSSLHAVSVPPGLVAAAENRDGKLYSLRVS